MSFEGLQERLAALQETTSQLKGLIDRLATLKFQPGSVPLGAEEENSVSGELSAEIGQTLRGGLEDQELLLEEVKYVRPEGQDKTRLQDDVERVGKELISCRFSFRRARLAAKKSLEEAQKLERELMLQSFSTPLSEPTDPLENEQQPEHYRAPRYVRQAEQSGLSENDQQTVGASSDVTNALRRTHDLIASELSRSDFAHQTLVESSAALKQLDESYGSLDTMLASSRTLLGTLIRSQKSDTWYLQTSMYMLMITGAWLVFRRLLYGPAWWLVWLPIRLLFGLGSTAGSALIGGRSEPAETGIIGGTRHTETVQGLPIEDLPTAKVGRESIPPVGHSDSMIDKVGKMVDAANEAEELGNIPEDAEGEIEEEGDIKKRAHEEPHTAAEAERPRDEL